MVIKSIKNENLFRVVDENTEHIFYGFRQEWYTTEWQRRAGCGPTVVANIIHYLNNRPDDLKANRLPLTKNKACLLMEDVYQYVTPTPRGIPSTKLLYEDVLNYAEAKTLNIKLEVTDVPEKTGLRPPLNRVISFLDKALGKDTPVAFLNLDSGAEKRLDSWHWVTIISLEYASDAGIAEIRILDGGTIFKVDLVKWFATTKLGGGFVSFEIV